MPPDKHAVPPDEVSQNQRSRQTGTCSCSPPHEILSDQLNINKSTTKAIIARSMKQLLRWYPMRTLRLKKSEPTRVKMGEEMKERACDVLGSNKEIILTNLSAEMWIQSRQVAHDPTSVNIGNICEAMFYTLKNSEPPNFS